MIKDKRIITILCFLFFIGCTSDEYQLAEHTYLQAKSTHHIDQLVSSLTVLARLAPEEYSPLLLKAKQAEVKLLESQKHIEQENFYLAYISSHDSLHRMYNIESKEALVKSGSIFFPLLKAKKKLDKSNQNQPLDLASLSHYKELPILDWDLIELNTLLKKLTENIISLEKSINIIKTIPSSSPNPLSSELLQIELRISNQIDRFKQAQNFLIDIALSSNAKLLISLNAKLSEENVTISQIFNKNRINKAMSPFIDRAKNKYASNKNVLENMFFAASSKAKKHHEVWFREWQKLEKDIFEPALGFVDYSFNANYRNERLMVYVNKKKIQLPAIENKTIGSMVIFQENKAISDLFEKLTKDRRFLIHK